MPPKLFKHKLLLDEGLFKRQSLKRINSRYNIKHIKHDLNKGGITDTEVYTIACKERRIIVTYNTGDFRKFAAKSNESGVIGVPQSVTPEQLDTKLNSLLGKSSEKSLYGVYTSLMRSR